MDREDINDLLEMYDKNNLFVQTDDQLIDRIRINYNIRYKRKITFSYFKTILLEMRQYDLSPDTFDIIFMQETVHYHRNDIIDEDTLSTVSGRDIQTINEFYLDLTFRLNFLEEKIKEERNLIQMLFP